MGLTRHFLARTVVYTRLVCSWRRLSSWSRGLLWKCRTSRTGSAREMATGSSFRKSVTLRMPLVGR